MGSCFPFLSREDNAGELAPFVSMNVHTDTEKQSHTLKKGVMRFKSEAEQVNE